MIKKDVGHHPVRTRDHLSRALHPSLSSLKLAMKEVDGFNAKIAVFVTSIVGTMWCAYLFTIIALLGLPAALKPSGEGIIAWIAQTFLQLVLLSVIMVGQNVQSIAADARSVETFKDAETIRDYLDLETPGGLETLMSKLDEIKVLLAKNEAPPESS